MPTPQFVTFTGIDSKTNLNRVKNLSARYPIEWGILFGGRIDSNRYPDADTVYAATNIEGLRLSAHFCGPYVRAAMTSAAIVETMEQGGSEPIKSPFGRFQINAGRYDIDALQQFQRNVGRPVVMQVRGKTFQEPLEGITPLFDASGGKGRVAKFNPVQRPGMPLVGYAGGIGQTNVLDILNNIDAHTFYIDMETGIRTDDWLDLDKCEIICKLIWP